MQLLLIKFVNFNGWSCSQRKRFIVLIVNIKHEHFLSSEQFAGSLQLRGLGIKK